MTFFNFIIYIIIFDKERLNNKKGKNKTRIIINKIKANIFTNTQTQNNIRYNLK